MEPESEVDNEDKTNAQEVGCIYTGLQDRKIVEEPKGSEDEVFISQKSAATDKVSSIQVKVEDICSEKCLEVDNLNYPSLPEEKHVRECVADTDRSSSLPNVRHNDKDVNYRLTDSNTSVYSCDLERLDMYKSQHSSVLTLPDKKCASESNGVFPLARVNCKSCDVNVEVKSSGNQAVENHRPFLCDVYADHSCRPKKYATSCKTHINGEAITSGNLNIHTRIHGGEKRYKCDICDTSFARIGHLIVHIRTHTGEKPYKCDVCGLSFAENSKLVNHKRTHTGEKPYKCDVCEASFSHSGNLTNHKLTHTGERPFKCDVCGTSFTRSSVLAKHKRKHTGEKPYKCDVCKMSFSCSSILAEHRRTHTGEKPYKCDDCQAAFAQKGNLIRHKKRHTTEKSYTCDICEITFAHSINLVSHKRIHMREKP